jgi:thiamine biosynthesis protein ThiS
LNRIPSPPGVVVANAVLSFMKIRINGEEKQVKEGIYLVGLLDELEIRPARVVVELNRQIVARQAYGSTVINDGDVLEIVHFVGGG